jgi:predicted dehydrogenase
MSTLRLGISGCGRLAEAGYLPALAGVPGLRLVAVCDPDAARRELVARVAGTGAAAYPSAEAMLESAGLDALLVCGPAATHLGDASMASRHGVRALVEKPPAADLREAREMAALELAPWLGFNRRFSALAGIRAELGPERPLELEMEIRYRRASWRPVSVRDDALADLGAHLADLAMWLGGGRPLRVATAELSQARAELGLEMSGGRALIRAATDRPFFERVASSGAERRIGGTARNVLARLRRGEGELVRSLRAELLAYEAALRTGSGGVLAGAVDGVRVMQVIEAARESARTGAPVDISPAAAWHRPEILA